jgi:S-adenosylmethionine uptake transporter
MSHFADRKVLGIVLALASYATYSLHYATMKWLGTGYSIWQLIFLRSLVMFLITLGLGRAATVKGFVASPYKLPTAIRGVLQFLCAYFFYVAANRMPLADVTTLYSAAPLMIVLLSIVVLGEKIHGLHWVAVILGLVGTAIAANPGADTDLLGALLALGAALFWALTVVFTRKSGARESSDVQLFTNSLVFMALSIGFATWQMPSSLYDWGLMLALGMQIYLAQLFFVEACRFAPASLVGPIEYSSLGWACLFGFLFFGDVPPMPVVAGGVLIVVSGVALAVGMRRMSKKSQNLPLAAAGAIEG